MCDINYSPAAHKDPIKLHFLYLQTIEETQFRTICINQGKYATTHTRALSIRRYTYIGRELQISQQNEIYHPTIFWPIFERDGYMWQLHTYKHHRRSRYIQVHILVLMNNTSKSICKLNFCACTTGRFCLWTNTCWHILDTGTCCSSATHEHVLTCSMQQYASSYLRMCVCVCMNQKV